jgi:outer membrane cobalamin receptor
MLAALLLSLAVAAASVTGIVKDETGGAVPGASVVVRSASGAEQQTVTGPDGRFTFDEVPEGATVIVRAGGFAEKQQPLGANGEMEIVLVPAALLETVTVTPLRSEEQLGNIPASVNILDSGDIRQSPALVADDVLRQIPTFSLFRRTSSLSSHPTSQGVSLRGIGPSGVSRTLVMVDGVPFNDPFGGWVYWTRVPMGSVDRIEVVDGASSNLYGNYAMGGVINILSARAARRTVELGTQFGNKDSRKLDYFGSDVWGKLGVVVEGSAFTTDGYPIVIENERGVIDNEAWVHFGNVNLKADYQVNDRLSAFVRGGYFSEDRSNGKIEEVNDTSWTAFTGGVRARLPGEGQLQASVFTDFTTFHSTFVAVPQTTPPRNTVRLSVDQRSPSDSVGGMVQWSRAFGTNHFLTVGGDGRWVDGDSLEDHYQQQGPITSPITGSVLVLKRNAGGTQRMFGAFVQDVFTPVSRLVVTLGVRLDSWRNYDGHHIETLVPSGADGPANRPTLQDTDETAGSPRVGALYHLSDKVRLWGDMSWGFRAPTLNELYRGFSVGVSRVVANELLTSEHLSGGEVGLSAEVAPKVIVRGTYYDNRVEDPVANVTIALNLQQRQNLGRTRIRGFQTDLDATLGEYVRVSAGYLFNNAKVVEAPGQPQLVGKYLAQVPKNRGSAQAVYSNPRWFDVGIGVQVIGRQFDDDLNLRTVPGESEPGLPAYAVVDLTAAKTFNRNFDLFVGVQNMLDEEYIVMTQPTTTGTPRLFHAGLRFRFAGR